MCGALLYYHAGQIELIKGEVRCDALISGQICLSLNLYMSFWEKVQEENQNGIGAGFCFATRIVFYS